MISPGYMQPFVRTNQKSPILDLPHDLTYLIFLTCHRDNPQNFSTTILRVCKQWRKAALAISELWSTINFDKNLKTKQVAERIQLQLERAQLALLHIHIFESAIHKPAIKNILKICQLMFPLVQQWGSLSIHGNVPHKALRLLLDRLTNTSVPRLEKLAIENNTVMRNPDMAVKWRFKAFGSGMPSLRYFQLSIYRPDRNSHTFDNLIELEIEDPQLLTMKEDKVATIVRDILIHSPRLRRLVITGPFTPKSWPTISRSRPPPTRDTIAHNAIKCINIVPHREGAVTDALLHLVEMPELEELTSDPSYYILPFSFHTLAHVNPLPNIRCIRIHGYEGPLTLSPQESTALPLALQAMHRLETLELRALDLRQSGAWLSNLLIWLPKLKSLEFRSCSLSASPIREMLECGRNCKSLILKYYSTIKTEGELIHSRSSSSEEFKSFLRSQVGKLITW